MSDFQGLWHPFSTEINQSQMHIPKEDTNHVKNLFTELMNDSPSFYPERGSPRKMLQKREGFSSQETKSGIKVPLSSKRSWFKLF